MDGRLVVGRTPENAYTISSPCEPTISCEFKLVNFRVPVLVRALYPFIVGEEKISVLCFGLGFVKA